MCMEEHELKLNFYNERKINLLHVPSKFGWVDETSWKWTSTRNTLNKKVVHIAQKKNAFPLLTIYGGVERDFKNWCKHIFFPDLLHTKTKIHYLLILWSDGNIYLFP